MGIKKTLLVALLLLWASSLQAANLLYSENFDDQDIDQPSVGSLYPRDNSGSITTPAYNLTETGRSGSGYCFSSGTSDSAYIQWDYGQNWPTTHMYVSFWMRYPTFTSNTPTIDNIKFFYPSWAHGTGNNYAAWNLYNGSTNAVFYSALHQGTAITIDNYYTASNSTDGNWHHYEFFVDFANGIVKFWYDDDGTHSSPITDEDYTEDWGATTSVTRLTFMGEDSTSANDFSRQLDDIEVWDGMPDSTPAPAPPTLSNVTISNGSFR